LTKLEFTRFVLLDSDPKRLDAQKKKMMDKSKVKL